MDNFLSNSGSINSDSAELIIISDDNSDASTSKNIIDPPKNNPYVLLDEPRHKQLTAKYWYAQPGKFVLDAFRNNKNQLYCDPETKLFPANFTIEGNGNKANAHGCFKCSVCKKKWRDTEFYVKILGGNPEDIPKKTPKNVSNKPDLPNITNFPQIQNQPANESILLSSNFDNVGVNQSKYPNILKGNDRLSPNQKIFNFSSENSIQNSISREKCFENINSSDSTSKINDQVDIVMSNILNTVNHKVASISIDSNNYPILQPTNQMIEIQKSSDSSQEINLNLENCLLKKQISDLNEKFDKLIQLNSKKSTPYSRSNYQTFSFLHNQNNKKTFKSSRKTTFIDIAKQRLKSGSNEEITKFSEAMRLLAGVKPLGTGTKSEKKHKVARLYVQGITRQPIHQVKKLLAILKFRLTKILHMDFIGKSTLEFTVMEEYARSFVTHIKAFQFMKIMKQFDPTKPFYLEATEQTKETIKQAYQNRINKGIQNTNKSGLREYLIDLADEHGLVVDPIVNEDSIPEEFYEDSDGDSVEMDEI
ncbi:hypothetical protein BB558_006886 [Smittium angustum]|uniref:Uncharacterized protein n=1 Tax=Smittium angustum TaxID=133377 RepID=A0A2U1IWI4_SMIAN|nr:hypothetical protein BB558_006886 [Smittium angustum]